MLRVYEFEYVEARRVLLDALEALGAQRRAVVLVGAQAIYHRVGEGTLQVAPFTSDGDLALHPALLEDEPLLAEAFINAGFAAGHVGPERGPDRSHGASNPGWERSPWGEAGPARHGGCAKSGGT